LAFVDTIRCIAKAMYLKESQNDLQFGIEGVGTLEQKESGKIVKTYLKWDALANLNHPYTFCQLYSPAAVKKMAVA